MSKSSVIARQKKREVTVAKFAAVRAELKATLSSPKTTDAEFYVAQRKLDKLPRNSSKVRLKNRCSITGRPRAFIGKFGVSRIQFRELALGGKLPGVIKASW